MDASCRLGGFYPMTLRYLSKRDLLFAVGFWSAFLLHGQSLLLHDESFTFTAIDVPNAQQTYATGINNAGEVVGWYHDAAGDHGFLRSPNGSKFMTFDDPDGVGGTSLQGINDSGYMTGSFYQLPTTNGTSFLIKGGTGFVNFTVPGAAGPTYAWKINNKVQIVGYFFREGSLPDVHGFVRNMDGSFIAFDDPDAPVGTMGTQGTVARGINDLGEIVGYLPGLNGNAAQDVAFLRSTNGAVYTTITVPDSRGTVATAINNRGDIVGYFDNLAAASLGFIRHRDGTFVTFEHPDAHGTTFPQGINDQGQVVGYYFDDAIGNRGFLATPHRQ
jgi:probable HAF family extracellular repeat protein